MTSNWLKAAETLKNGKLAVIPTDTINGLVSLALDKKAVALLYKVRGRAPRKPCIVLCSSVEDLSIFVPKIDDSTYSFLSKIWPNPVSVILSCPNREFSYLHRGMKTLAIRVPKNQKLLELIRKTGPIIAPSANIEGQPPARNTKEARSYFGDKVSVYVDGKVSDRPSTIISLVDGKIKMIREGAWRVPKDLMDSVK